ncbi:related to RRP3-protein involved in rRNA processing [Sporisorium reilianum f. sp. reilianum]|uniref:RNA helicase n=1 Tax=Sporisorium reilianum f. sp. reilianum TaxID=72559 RepID=A0A2N8U749_9BASI|nr:related to RRP3-protein involved in rRNA processing [Sporisorium reilianum f. sp. reilianum]
MLRAAKGVSKNVETLLSRSSAHRSAQHGSCFRSYLQFSTTPGALASTSLRQSTDVRSALHWRCYSTASASTAPNLDSDESLTGSDEQAARKRAPTEGVEEKFQRLGLNANISRQLARTHPNIQRPTPAQSALIPAILSPSDVILRAHTGTGKSFGILLALLSKPRIVFRDQTSQDAGSSSSKGKRSKPQTGIASIILVPSNELAFQYMRWARSLFPASSLPSLDPVIQCLVRGGLAGTEARTPQEELELLKSSPPHILIGTPGRIKDILDTPAGSSVLGLDTLKTLVLDEADAVLQLPGRFPSHKQRWKHEVHKAPGLLVLNDMMKRRATFSGGEKHLSAGLENRPGKRRDERRPPEHVRRNTYKAAERSSSIDPNTGLALPKPRGAGVQPLQLVTTSATANSVMRHFFGARTGWLRTGAKDSGLTFAPQVGRWIDLTGLSGRSMVDQGIRGLFGVNERSRTEALIETSVEQTASTMPASIEHTCVVVDEAPLSKQLSAVPLRNFEPKLARKKDAVPSTEATATSGGVGDDYAVIKPEDEPQEHEMDQSLIEALAFCFASEGVERGLALIPARWSLLRTRAALEALQVTVRLASDVTSTQAGAHAEPELFLLQTTSSRGLDIPALSHVFLVGYASVIDAVQYVHSAGRVARIGGDPEVPATGKVVTLLRGLPHNTPLPDDLQSAAGADAPKPKKAISTSEAKMANVYRRLGVVPRRFDLDLLKANARSDTQSEQPESAAAATEPSLTQEVAPEEAAESDELVNKS